ncbi:FTR1 family protein [Candidatus Binatus soli]|jgi:high-affinity iron transporter|uniref:FTR1 family protein n=1 Tax=Candidatus Binatus soli TaxID=1953413 RepID=UPI003D147E4F
MSKTVLSYFLYSVGILFREGTEAMLVIVALTAATREPGRHTHPRDIYAGAAAAIVASILLAVAVNYLISDDASDTLEGVFQLFAAATLLYVISRLIANSQSERSSRFIRAKLRNAERIGLPALALGLTAFLAVMRKGADTIVSLQALSAGAAAGAEHYAVAAGIAAAAFALAALFVIIEWSAGKIAFPIVCKTAAVMLYAMAVIFIGQGVASLQEADWVAATFVDYVPTLPALGIFPTVQTLGAQATLLLAATALFVPRYAAARAAERAAIAAD